MSGKFMIYQLVILNGERRGERITVTREPMIIGRDETCAIRFDDPEIAPTHAELSQKPEGLFIRDLGSMNRLMINNRAVREVHPQHGDVIEVGQTRFMVQFRDHTESPREEDDEPRLVTRWLKRVGVLLLAVGLLYAMMQCRPTLPDQPPIPVRPTRPTPSRTNAAIRTQVHVPQPEAALDPSMPAPAAEPEVPKSPSPSSPPPDTNAALNVKPAAREPVPAAPVAIAPSATNPSPELSTANAIIIAQQEIQEAERELLDSKIRDMMEEAQNLASNKGPAAAEQVLMAIEALKPDFLEASAARAAMLEEQGKLDPALMIWERLRRKAPVNTPLAIQVETKLKKLTRARNQLVFPFVGRIKIVGVDLNKALGRDPSRSGQILSLRLVATELQPEIDPEAVRVEMRFYDQDVQTEKIIPTDAKVSIAPLAAPGPWRATEEKTVDASYAAAPGTTNTPAARYYGYVIRVRYYGALQDERIQPGDLPATDPQAEPTLTNES
jgi:pSer/pThr/pTyr-binding forkhead associated (FHA) protein